MRLVGLFMLAFAFVMHLLGSPYVPLALAFAWLAGVAGPSLD